MVERWFPLVGQRFQNHAHGVDVHVLEHVGVFGAVDDLFVGHLVRADNPGGLQQGEHGQQLFSQLRRERVPPLGLIVPLGGRVQQLSIANFEKLFVGLP
ncbi:hypothetical protein [Mycolicibacterium houstonense]|uniref:hypothetical protein n=1 Tax=Mycolicibacterium houstonense TaxID=146021 RepID=UPI00082E1C6F|nr:hypothetical protein [Mycolicibacterium houstonense]